MICVYREDTKMKGIGSKQSAFYLNTKYIVSTHCAENGFFKGKNNNGSNTIKTEKIQFLIISNITQMTN